MICFEIFLRGEINVARAVIGTAGGGPTCSTVITNEGHHIPEGRLDLRKDAPEAHADHPGGRARG
jgi:hypothetical protein